MKMYELEKKCWRRKAPIGSIPVMDIKRLIKNGEEVFFIEDLSSISGEKIARNFFVKHSWCQTPIQAIEM